MPLAAAALLHYKRSCRKRPGGILTTTPPFCAAPRSISSSVRIMSKALNTHLTAGSERGERGQVNGGWARHVGGSMGMP